MPDFKIEIENLRKSFSRPVLDKLSLTVQAGEFVSIIGSSGSGKSTLLNIIGLIEHFDAGTYRFNGHVIEKRKDYAAHRLNDIGFIFQNYNMIDRLSGVENVHLPLQYSKGQAESAISLELMELFSIKRYWLQNVNELSGGEKQRLAIVRALIRDPRLILADEPGGNLDAENNETVLYALRHAQKHGKAVVLVTHDLELARVADTCYSLKDGVLVHA